MYWRILALAVSLAVFAVASLYAYRAFTHSFYQG
jgi:hypothetical protein